MQRLSSASPRQKAGKRRKRYLSLRLVARVESISDSTNDVMDSTRPVRKFLNKICLSQCTRFQGSGGWEKRQQSTDGLKISRSQERLREPMPRTTFCAAECVLKRKDHT